MDGPGLGLRLLRQPRRVEAALWRRLKVLGDDRCRAALFDAYCGFARAIALREFRRRGGLGLDRPDYEQLACAGLLEAIDGFDPARGAPFPAYAKHRIRGAIADGAARASEAGAQYRCRQRLEAERLRSLRSAEASASGDFIAELADLASAIATGIIAENANVAEATPSGGYKSLRWREVELAVLREIERLPEQERRVMQQHYFNALPFAQIAQLMGLSKGRISQLHRCAIERVRQRIKYGE